MRQGGFSLLELLMWMSMFTAIAGVLVGLSAQLVGQGQRLAADPEASADRLAWQLRLAADQGWWAGEQHLRLGELQLSNDADDIVVNQEVALPQAQLRWYRDDQQQLWLELHSPRRDPLRWRLCPQREQQQQEQP